MLSISSYERTFIEEGIAQNVRNDGRGRMDYRHFDVKTGAVPHANGSARLQLDTTDILVGVNLEIGQPDPDKPTLGKIVCSVECTTSASAAFEGRGANDLNVTLAGQLEKILLNSQAFDLASLCIIPGQTCWVLYVDALVLDSAGSLLDAIALCSKAALMDTLVPAIRVVKGDSEGELDIDVDDDPYTALPLVHDKVGVCVSLTKVGSYFIVDASLEEEECMATRISVTVSKKGNICGVHKTGPGGISPSALGEMMSSARKIGLTLHERLESVLSPSNMSDD